MNNSFVSQLNSLASAYGVSDRVRFYGENAAGVAVKVAPFARVAVLYSARSFESFGKDLTVTLKKAGIKPLNFIMPSYVTVKLENVLDVVGVPEDVRAIMCNDRALLPVAAYLATVFNIPVVYNMRSLNADGVIPAKIPFSFGVAGAETVAVNCVYHIAVDFENLSDEDIADGFLSLVAKRVALSDYRAKIKILNKKAKKTLCDEIKGATDAVKSFTKANAKEIAFSGLKTELADFAMGGEITYNSALYSFKLLTGFAEDDGRYFAFLQKLTALYLLCAENQDMPFDLPDYNARTKSLATLTGLDDGKFLRGFKAQKKALKSADLSAIKVAMKKELADLSSFVKKAEKTYIDLGGKISEDFSAFICAFISCGDLPETLNFMTVVRECGFLEFD